MNRKSIVIAVMIAAASLVLAQRVTENWEARMTGSTSAKGKAKFRIRDRGNQRETQLEFEGENLAPNTGYTVTLSTGNSYAVTTNGLGAFAYAARVDSANRPAINASTVAAIVSPSGAKIASGNFTQR